MTFQSIEIFSNFSGEECPNLSCGSCLQDWRDSLVIKKLKKPYIFYLLILSTFNSFCQYKNADLCHQDCARALHRYNNLTPDLQKFSK